MLIIKSAAEDDPYSTHSKAPSSYHPKGEGDV
jgi:hypothetical protein